MSSCISVWQPNLTSLEAALHDGPLGLGSKHADALAVIAFVLVQMLQ